MKVAYYLSTCSTCQRIMNDLPLAGFTLREIKSNAITEKELEQMKDLAGSYEQLFSRRAMKYKSMGLNKQELKESDYKQLILEEYTFLKRPVFIIDNQIFVGNSKKTIDALRDFLS